MLGLRAIAVLGRCDISGNMLPGYAACPRSDAVEGGRIEALEARVATAAMCMVPLLCPLNWVEIGPSGSLLHGDQTHA